MAIGANFFSGMSGAVGDIFSGKANATGLRIKASGTEIEADSTRLNAEGLRLKAKGNIAEAENYNLAGELAGQNLQYTEANAGVQQALADRSIYQGIGAVKAAGAGAGLTMDSVTDILADSARQGAIQKQLLGEQNLITEAGIKEQQKSYENLESYARYGASVQNDMAGKMDEIAGKQIRIAGQERDLADETEKNSYITAGIKGAGAIFSLFSGSDLLAGAAGGGGG